MGRTAEIDLVGEILPVGLLRCKNALDDMASREVLCIATDDPIVIEGISKLIRPKGYRVLRRQREAQLYRIHILKE